MHEYAHTGIIGRAHTGIIGRAHTGGIGTQWGAQGGTPKIRNSAGRRSRHIGVLRADPSEKSCQSPRGSAKQRILSRFGTGRGRNRHGVVGKVRCSAILGPWQTMPFQGVRFLKIGPVKNKMRWKVISTHRGFEAGSVGEILSISTS